MTTLDIPTPKTGCFRVCFLLGGGCTDSQGRFRTREEAKRWAGKRPCWVVWEPVFPGEKVKWTVRAAVNKPARRASEGT